MSYPTPEELGDFAKQIIMEVMAPRGGSSTGSDKSGPGEWYTKDCIADPLYHSRRVVNHALSAIGLSGRVLCLHGPISVVCTQKTRLEDLLAVRNRRKGP